MIRGRQRTLKLANLELADKKGLNLGIKAEALGLKSQMEKEIYQIEFTCELLKAELDWREKDHSEQREVLQRDNLTLNKKMAKLVDVLGSIHGQRNPIETDFYGKLEEFVAKVSL